MGDRDRNMCVLIYNCLLSPMPGFKAIFFKFKVCISKLNRQDQFITPCGCFKTVTEAASAPVEEG